MEALIDLAERTQICFATCTEIRQKLGFRGAIAQQNWCVAASKPEARDTVFFYICRRGFRSGVGTSPTIIILLAAWLGLNVAFVAVRIYVTSDRRRRNESEVVEYPRLVS
jgi:hypothetical protein